jgi:hypothetical protein
MTTIYLMNKSLNEPRPGVDEAAVNARLLNWECACDDCKEENS